MPSSTLTLKNFGSAKTTSPVPDNPNSTVRRSRRPAGNLNPYTPIRWKPFWWRYVGRVACADSNTGTNSLPPSL